MRAVQITHAGAAKILVAVIALCFALSAVPSSAQEAIEADVSTRRVAVTSGFTGTEIVVFGAIVNAKAGGSPAYDVIVVVDGTDAPLVTRKKSRIAGIWINTDVVQFERLPSYYTITSTRPISAIAPRAVMQNESIGFDHIPMVPAGGKVSKDEAEVDQFRKAVIRLKKKQKLFVEEAGGVSFIGRNLFRSSVKIPANVPVGPLKVNVYLFRDGKLLAKHQSDVSLRREGLERFLHSFAFDYPFYYGLIAVLIAVASGLLASATLQRKR